MAIQPELEDLRTLATFPDGAWVSLDNEDLPMARLMDMVETKSDLEHYVHRLTEKGRKYVEKHS